MLRFRIKLLFGMLAFTIVLCGCSHICGPSGMMERTVTEWVVVARVGGTDTETQNEVRDVLEKKGIVCAMEGSIIYAVLVPRPCLAEAEKLLREDPRLKRVEVGPKKMIIYVRQQIDTTNRP